MKSVFVKKRCSYVRVINGRSLEAVKIKERGKIKLKTARQYNQRAKLSGWVWTGAREKAILNPDGKSICNGTMFIC